MTAVSLDGSVSSAGDTAALFSMQSMSKAAALAFAVETLGKDKVFSRIGMSPCSEPFNSIMKLEMTSKIPLNPFINSGAIVLTGVIHENLGDRAMGMCFEAFKALMGRGPERPLSVNQAIYHSENATADRNRALAYFLHSLGSLTTNVEETLDIYFQLCSLEVNTLDLAMIGATFANGGVNPKTGMRVISLDTAYLVMGLMEVCGLYDESAEFAVSVGVPAKSGVSGGILCAVPGKMGLAVYSPPLNQKGNSVAGMAALEKLSRQMALRGI
jgi:glutaminase